MGMKILVLGGYGVQGSVICTDLSKSPEISEVVCAGRKLETAKRLVNWLNSEKVSAQRVDVSKTDDLRKALREIDVVVNSTLPRFNLKIMEEALQAGAHYVDLASGPPYENIPRELELSDKWKDAGLTALINTGISPGITNVLAKNATEKLDRVNEVIIRFYAKFKAKESISRWSPETMWMDMAEEPVVFENGKFKKVPPFSGREVYKFPDPYGPQTVVWHAHEEVHTLPRFIGKGLRFLDFKYPYDPVTDAVVQLGLVSDKPIEVNGIEVVPRKVLFALTPHTLAIDEMASKIEAGVVVESSGCVVVEVRGEKKGEKAIYTLYVPFPSIQEAHERIPGATHTSYVTSVPPAIFTKMLGNREIKTVGVIPPEGLEQEARKAFLTKLAEKGIVAHEKVEKRLA
ncbi:MAG: saccharopine dehydrogenase NADP-binding domain-containing protein [Candidatus Bathyarchaeota archaeon]|nr:saccharopine dehydrogenase NADP-binding domain-containing protein [Candidatus Bathyarchaeota archaeon]